MTVNVKKKLYLKLQWDMVNRTGQNVLNFLFKKYTVVLLREGFYYTYPAVYCYSLQGGVFKFGQVFGTT